MLILNFFLIIDNYNPENINIIMEMLYINNLVVCNTLDSSLLLVHCSFLFFYFYYFGNTLLSTVNLAQFSLQFLLGTRHKLFMILKACVLLISSLAFGFSCASYPFDVGSLKCILTNLNQKYLYSWQIKQVFHQSDKSAC